MCCPDTPCVCRYDLWLSGQDWGHHPCDDPKTTGMTLAQPPSAEEFLVNRTNTGEQVCGYIANQYSLLWLGVIAPVCVGSGQDQTVGGGGAAPVRGPAAPL